MPMKLLTADDFREGLKSGERPEGTVFRFATTDPVTVGEQSDRTKRFVFSDATIDHSGDSIDQKGWDLGVFNKNPVALFSHMSWDPPIGRASNVSVEKGQLKGDIEFASADVYEFADTIYRLVDGGFLKAVSVGFIPKTWAFSKDKDRPYGIDFKTQQLLEISVCPVPCNPNALGEARSIGVDTRPLAEWAEKVLDTGDVVFLPRKELETLRLQAKENPAMTIFLGKLLAEKAAGEGSNAAGGALVATPIGNCGRTEDEECGMKNEQECSIHFTPPPPPLKSKAGRRVSQATKAKLQEAMDHHAKATECLMSIMGDSDGDSDIDDPSPSADANDDEPDGAGPTEFPPATVVPDEHDKDLSPEERRLKEARALRELLKTDD